MAVIESCLDLTEQAIVKMYRDAKLFGFGRIEIVVVNHKMNKLYNQVPYTEDDLEAYLGSGSV